VKSERGLFFRWQNKKLFVLFCVAFHLKAVSFSLPLFYICCAHKYSKNPSLSLIELNSGADSGGDGGGGDSIVAASGARLQGDLRPPRAADFAFFVRR